MNYRDQLQDLITYVNRHFIAEIPRNVYAPNQGLRMGNRPNQKKKKDGTDFHALSTTLLFLNSSMGMHSLLEGGRGSGKTRLTSAVGALLFQLPYEFLTSRRVVGIPGATINDVYATHDLAEMNRGNDVAFLYAPFHAPFLNIDELNRFSEMEQNRIREGIATGIWGYANHSWQVSPQVVVSAMNPQSYGGTFPLNDNLVDNYSIFIEPPRYNALLHAELVVTAEMNMKRELGLEGEVKKFLLFYQKHKNDAKLVEKELVNLQEKTSEAYQKRDIPFLQNGFLEEISKEVEAVPFAPEAMLFFQASLAELTRTVKYGFLRVEDPKSDDTHDLAYVCTKIQEGLEGRFLQDWRRMSKALAWYLGQQEVGVNEVKAAFMYTSPGRLQPELEFSQGVLNSPRQLPYRMEMARQIIEECWSHYSAIKDSNGMEMVRRAIRIINNEERGTLDSAIKILNLVDHPLAQVVLEGIALHQWEKRSKI